MKRLTDKRTAEALKKNCEGLMKVGIQPDRMYLEYIKLAEYEEAEERRELCGRESEDYYE